MESPKALPRVDHHRHLLDLTCLRTISREMDRRAIVVRFDVLYLQALYLRLPLICCPFARFLCYGAENDLAPLELPIFQFLSKDTMVHIALLGSVWYKQSLQSTLPPRPAPSLYSNTEIGYMLKTLVHEIACSV